MLGLNKEHILLVVALVCVIIYFNRKKFKSNSPVKEIVSYLPVIGGLSFGLNTLVNLIIN